ncbi:MAG: hypothetical protein IJ806_06690 [Ruminococcus sp.]|nr:hypothetical protein [Ruminococcus sp.]
MKTYSKKALALSMALILLMANIMLFGAPFAVRASAEGRAVKTYRCTLSPDMDGWWATTYNLKDLEKNAIIGGKDRYEAELTFYDDGTFRFHQPAAYSGGNIAFPDFTVTGSYFNSDGKEKYENTLMYYGESYSPSALDFGRQTTRDGKTSWTQSIDITSANVYAAREVSDFAFDITDLREMFRWDMERGYLYVVFKGKITISGSSDTKVQPDLSRQGIVVHMCYDVHEVSANSLGLGWLYDMLDPTKLIDGKINEVIDTKANEKEGETEESVSAKIVEGVKDVGKAGAAAGAAGAAAAALTSGTADDEKRKKQSEYKMKIYKDFGNTIDSSAQPFIYARMVEINEDGETVRSDLTARISIFAANEGLIVESAGMNDIWQTARLTLNPDRGDVSEGIVAFRFTGEGGSFTNNVHFELAEPRVVFHQEHMAIPALQEKEELLNFDVEGFDTETLELEAEYPSDFSYAVALLPSENVPTSFFAVFVDINTTPGEAGTCDSYTFTVKAHDRQGHEAEGSITVHRVNIGLNISAAALNCYRIMKEEAQGKSVDDLTRDDFYISYTKTKAMLLLVNEEEHLLMHVPVVPKADVVPLPTLSDTAKAVSQQRLEGIGIECRTIALNDGYSDVVFLCKKGWLEPPGRFRALLRASVVFDGKEYTMEKEVLLRSQARRSMPGPEDVDRYAAIDEKIGDALEAQKAWIEDGNLLDYLPGEYLMIKQMLSAYDINYGYDPILYAQIVFNIEVFVDQARRYELKQRQAYLEDAQATAYSNMSFWSCVSRSFAKVSEDHLEGWSGLAVRMGAGFLTGGLSEAVFLTMDVNKAVSDYNEQTLLSKRTFVGQLTAGALPVGFYVVGGAIMKGGTKVVAKLAPDLLPGLKQLALDAANAGYKKLPASVRYVSSGIARNMKAVAEKVNSWDPRAKMIPVANAERAAAQSRLQAAGKLDNMVRDINRKGLTQRQQMLESIEMAANRRGKETINKLTSVGERYRANPHDPQTVKELKEVTVEIMGDKYSRNQLNNLGKHEYEIVSNTPVADYRRQLFNNAREKLIEEPAGRVIKARGAAMKNTTPDKIKEMKVTGNSAEARKAGIKSPDDLDTSPMYEKRPGQYEYFTQSEMDELVYPAYCDKMGLRYNNLSEARFKANQKGILAVGKGHEEFYPEFQKVGTAEAFSEEVMPTVTQVAQNKTVPSFESGMRKINSLTDTAAKSDAVMRSCRDYASGRISYEQLSSEARQCIEGARECMQGAYQTPKVKTQMDAKNIQGMANGHANQFSEADEMFAGACDRLNKEGSSHISLGQFDAVMERMQSDYSTSAREMIFKYRAVNSNCRGPSLPQSGTFSPAGTLSQFGLNGFGSSNNDS